MISGFYILAIIALHVIGSILSAPDCLFYSFFIAIFLILAWLVSPGRDLGRVFIGEKGLDPIKQFALILICGSVFFFAVAMPKDVSLYERFSAGLLAGSWFLLFYTVAFRIVRRIIRWFGLEDAATKSGTNRGLGSLMARSSSLWPLYGNDEKDGRVEELGFRAGRYVAGLRRRMRRPFG